jgi:hypothetical protein
MSEVNLLLEMRSKRRSSACLIPIFDYNTQVLRLSFFLLVVIGLTGLAPPPIARAAFDPSRVLVRPQSASEIRYLARAKLALAAATAPYSLPNLNSGLDRAAYKEAFRAFLAKTPAGYELWGADADLATGLKFVIYKPTAANPDFANAPWVLAITGTETLLDWLSNSDLARPQFLGLRKIVELFSGNLLEDRELLITGHSLGGALAQAAAHEILKNRKARQLTMKPISLITWNGFGAQELIAKVSAFHPELAQEIYAVNYFVRGDIVSQIGTHFGRTFELLVPTDPAASALSETLRLHSLSTFSKIVNENRVALLQAKPVAPPRSSLLAGLTKISWLLSYLEPEVHEFRQLWISRWIRATLAQAQRAELLDAADRASYLYVYNVGVTELKRLATDTDPDKKQDRIALERELERFRIFKDSAQ